MLPSYKRSAIHTSDLKSKVRKVNITRMSEVLKTPVKSYSDKKEYRLIKLPNGLTSLMIQHFIESDDTTEDNQQVEPKLSESDVSMSGSHETDDSEDEEDDEDDSREKMAAVALCVRVGSFYDPENIQGLSHFLEHMIFMGSEKYPKENEYDQFITANGGSDNALTECEYTMFYFEIVEEHLAGAIDRFAQLFVSPLMLKDSMEREMEAVESEFQNNISDDDNRIMQLVAKLANGPASTFTWGNLKTLKEGISNAELYKAVHDYRKKHYIANRMFLCVESSAELDEQQKLVEKNFTAIKSGPEPEPLAAVAPVNHFKPEFFDKVYYVKPKADKNNLYINFLLPSMEKHYKSKPHDYLAYIIQHEGVGSLSSYLKKKLLAVRIEAGAEDESFEGNSMFMLFAINVELTEEGLANIEAVLEAIFSFLLLLKVTPIADHEKAFMELKRIKDTSFKYREEKTSSENVEDLVVNLMYYTAPDVLNGSDILFEFDGAIVQDVIERLNQRKFNLLLLTDKHEKYEKTEKWFGTEYDEVDFPQSYIDLWNNRKLKDEFSMPPPNDFICSNFDIISMDMDPQSLPLYPSKVLDNDIVECFYKLDGQFKLPHAFIHLYLISPPNIASVRNVTLNSLFNMLVKHYMSEKMYPARVAGLGYQLYVENKGLLMKFSGYNEKLALLVDIITKELTTISTMMELKVFETQRKQYIKNCYNNLIESKFLNKNCRLNIVEEHHKFAYDRYLEVQTITFDDLVDFADEFLKHLKIQILVQGNVAETTAIQIAKDVVTNLKCKEIDATIKIDSSAYKIPPGSNVLHIKSMLPNDKNSTTTNYIQLGASSIRLQCLIEFIEKIMEEPLFDILRTQEQFGYSVSCSHRFNNGVLGFSVSVQSQEDKNPTSIVEKRIEKFLQDDFLQVLEKLSDEDFETFRSSLIKLKHMVEVELESEVNRHWAEITSREYIFNRLKLEAEMIAQLTKQEVFDFYHKEIISSIARKLSIQVIGIGKDEAAEPEGEHVAKLEILNRAIEGQNVITDFKAFKKSLELYPVTKTINNS